MITYEHLVPMEIVQSLFKELENHSFSERGITRFFNERGVLLTEEELKISLFLWAQNGEIMLDKDDRWRRFVTRG